MIVHQLLSGAGPFDAVTTQARRIRHLLRDRGVGGGDHAVHIDPRVADAIGPLRRLDPGPRDVLLLHHSAYAPGLGEWLERGNPSVLLSHNVTPAAWFWEHAPAAGVQCQMGRVQQRELAARATVVAGVSAYNAAELGGERVIPILFEPERHGAPATSAARARKRAAGPPTILVVGRRVPHKRPDVVVRTAARLVARHPGLVVRVIGEPLGRSFDGWIRGYAEELAPDVVRFEEGLPQAVLDDAYRGADLLLSASEHEGFCIPVLEAFHHGVPVVARATGGLVETAGDAALLAAPEDDEAVLAELAHLALCDAALRETLVGRGRARLAHYDAAHTRAGLWAALEDAAGA